MFGVKIENMSENGNTTKCTVTVKFNGPTEEGTKESTKTTKNKDKGFFTGLTAESTLEPGKMDNSMARATITSRTDRKNSGSGSKARELDG